MFGMVPCQADIAPLYSAGHPSLLLADLSEGPLIQIERFGYEKFCKTRFTKKHRSVRRWWSTCWMSMMITIWLVNVSLTLIISNSVKCPRKLCSIFRPWVFIGHTVQKSPSHTRPIRKFPKRARIHVIIYKRSSKSKEKDETEHDCVFSYIYYQPNNIKLGGQNSYSYDIPYTLAAKGVMCSFRTWLERSMWLLSLLMCMECLNGMDFDLQVWCYDDRLVEDIAKYAVMFSSIIFLYSSRTFYRWARAV